MVEMEGESRSGREETHEAENSSRGSGLSNPSSNARRKRSRSRRRSEAESSSGGRGISNTSSSSHRNVRRSQAESSSPHRSISNPSSLPRRNALRRSRSVENDRRSRSVENDRRSRSVDNGRRTLENDRRRSRSVDNDRSVGNDRRRSRSGSRDNDLRRRSGTLDNDRRRSNRRRSNRSSNSVDGTIISSNQPSSVDGTIIGSNRHNDDIDVSSRRRRTARMSVPQWDNINLWSNPATVTQRSYIISDNPTLEVIRSRQRRQELFFITLQRGQLLMMIPDDQPIRPADRDAVQQLPRVVISEEHINNNDDNSTCSICLEKYQVGEEARFMECGHMYHKTCIFEWLENQHTCPLCRFEMPSTA